MPDLDTGAPAGAADEELLPSIDETMAAAYDAAQDDSGEADAADRPAGDSGPARGPDGKFVARAGGDQQQDKPAGAEKAAAAQDDAGKQAADPATPRPPASMTAEEKAAFDKLPPDAKAFLARRESDVTAHLTKTTQELAESKRRYAALDQVIEPRRQAWAMERMSPEMAVSQLLAISDKANADPAGFIAWFAQQRGIDLAQLTAARSEPEYVDPKLAALERTVQTLTQHTQAQQSAAHAAAMGEIQNVVQAFAGEADAQGKPAHPHYGKLEAEIAHIIPALRRAEPHLSHRDALQKAYDRAVWANPETRALLQAELAAAEAAKRQAEQAERAKNARRSAGTSLSNRGAVAGSSGPAATIDQTMSEVYDRLHGAA